jgi:hypothetical protein
MKIRLRAAIAAAAITVLCGCASAPENIAPAYVSTLTYASLTCEQLGEEEARVNAAYVLAAGQQRHARKDDAVGVALLGLPMGSMTGQNVAPQVASLKGQQNAIHDVEIQKDCGVPAAAH